MSGFTISVQIEGEADPRTVQVRSPEICAWEEAHDASWYGRQIRLADLRWLARDGLVRAGGITAGQAERWADVCEWVEVAADPTPAEPTAEGSKSGRKGRSAA